MGQHMEAVTVFYYVCQQIRANPMEIGESFYERLHSCVVAIALFHKIY